MARSDSRVPPHNLDAEQSLIGAMLLSRDVIARTGEMGLQAVDFYKPGHVMIVDAIHALARGHVDVDVVTLADYLRKLGVLDEVGGAQYLVDLQNATPAISNAGRYARIVQSTATLRKLLRASSEIAEIAYLEPDDIEYALIEAAARVGQVIDEADVTLLRGYYDDIASIDPGGNRDDAQPWIGRGILRRGQRMLVVARAGIGKSTLLRQFAMCCVNGVHPITGQPTERTRPSLVVELEASDWDIAQSVRDLLVALQRSTGSASMGELYRPALLHRPGGIDIRTPTGFATIEAAIRRATPELVVMGPVKYLSIAKPGENYEIAALNLMHLLNDLIARYKFALVMEVHFSRGDHGAPGGSERWVDWPDIGFGIHPPDDDAAKRLQVGGDGVEMTVKQFRSPRDANIWLPSTLIRGADRELPWSAQDEDDWRRYGATIFVTKYGGQSKASYTPWVQEEF